MKSNKKTSDIHGRKEYLFMMEVLLLETRVIPPILRNGWGKNWIPFICFPLMVCTSLPKKVVAFDIFISIYLF